MQTAVDCLMDAVPHGALLVDAAGRIVLANAHAASLLGHAHLELAGRRLDAFVAEPCRPGLAEAGARLLGECPLSGARHGGTVQLLRRDGSERSALLELRRVSHDGQPSLLVALQDPLASLPPFEHFALALEAASTGMILSDASGRIVLANTRVERMFGYERGQLAGEPIERLVPAPLRDRHQGLRAAFSRDAQTRGMGAGQDLHGVRKDGRSVPVEIGLNALSLNGAQYVLSSIADISERQLAERALRESEARHRALFEDSPVPLFELDLGATRAYLAALEASGLCAHFEAHFEAHPEALQHAVESVETIAMNQSALELFEASDPARLGDPVTLFAPETARWFVAALRELWAGRPHFGGETATRTLSGAARTVGMRIHLLPGHTETWSRAVVSLFDLTAHEQVEERLRSSLREKEVLLREVHHRVKNNLQIVSSLLNLKADTIDNAAAQHVFADCQARIRSLAFVHEHLYVASDLSHVPFGQYVRTLAAHLEQSCRAPGQRVSVRVAVGELNLSIDDAIPCGLIVNELVTNSLKHAFAPGGVGTIEIRMRRMSGRRLELSVSDDGKGLPSGFGPDDTGGSGLDLVYTFAEQLGAVVNITRQSGTRFSFQFEAAGGNAGRSMSC